VLGSALVLISLAMLYSLSGSLSASMNSHTALSGSCCNTAWTCMGLGLACKLPCYPCIH
jgi:hypothetical protein